jgi:hypothetical protein
MAALVFFLGLSLAGQFEIGLTLTGAGNDLARKQALLEVSLLGCWQRCCNTVHGSHAGRGCRLCTFTAGGNYVSGLHDSGSWPGVAVFDADIGTEVDFDTSEARCVNGCSEAAYGCASVRYRNLAGVGLWPAIWSRRDEPHGINL